jgi:hypothetical protein
MQGDVGLGHVQQLEALILDPEGLVELLTSRQNTKYTIVELLPRRQNTKYTIVELLPRRQNTK